jgi:hypothetical protein
MVLDVIHGDHMEVKRLVRERIRRIRNLGVDIKPA